MKCEEAAEWFGIYRDLPEDSPERLAVDLHVHSCSACEAEFRIWEESALLLHEWPTDDTWSENPVNVSGLNESVMNRIYSEQSWYMPTVRRTYTFSYAFRRKVAGLLAALLALFVCGFLYTSFSRAHGLTAKDTGIMETANAFAASQQLSSSVHVDVPVASLSDPIMLHVTPSMPEYWIAFSMLGIIMTLLILNWFSRVRA
ncbi:hypothetical protein SD71_17570 [Cohnella kolymensis]|uniref:Zinc-finger domain-containing protein n=1 Tax=Cohnella kolymensis TaxID=1590652 RepID=A0ABR5A1M0_9BACL|nr:hypothetical protein [Cohnella kolymensis]KIL34822.1 hypothetical protein SD71_17570 [Cohnella kolymensis]